MVAVTMVLNRMAQSENKLSVIHQSLPQYKIVKDKVRIDGVNVEEFLGRVDSIFQDGEKNTIDGLKITWDEKWVHLRGSNTEPIIRIYAEASSEEIATQLIKKVKDLSLIHISEPTRLGMISYAVFCLKKKKRRVRL